MQWVLGGPRVVPLSLRMAVPALQLLDRECSISILSPDTSILGVLFHLKSALPRLPQNSMGSWHT